MASFGSLAGKRGRSLEETVGSAAPTRKTQQKTDNRLAQNFILLVWSFGDEFGSTQAFCGRCDGAIKTKASDHSIGLEPGSRTRTRRRTTLLLEILRRNIQDRHMAVHVNDVLPRHR